MPIEKESLMNVRFMLVVSSALMVNAWSPQSFAAIYAVRPLADTFITTAGAGSPYPNIAYHNFGGAGSRGVSSADWIGAGQTAPKGASEALLRFSGIDIAEPDITSLSLSLVITKDMSTGSKNVFNKTGDSGYFNVYLLPASYAWSQGYDSPETAANSSDYGVTWSLLHNDPAYADKYLLATLYYDYTKQVTGARTTFDLTSALTQASLIDALHSSGSFTLLIAPADGSAVCFNFAAYTQNNGNYLNPQDPTIRDTGPTLNIVAVPEPAFAGLMVPAIGLLLGRHRRAA
jgi:hypothetical protein